MRQAFLLIKKKFNTPGENVLPGPPMSLTLINSIHVLISMEHYDTVVNTAILTFFTFLTPVRRFMLCIEFFIKSNNYIEFLVLKLIIARIYK